MSDGPIDNLASYAEELKRTESFDDGGSAFPVDVYANKDNRGMTLRDYFAAKALIGYIAVHAAPGYSLPKREDIALWAYSMADAMLDVRSKTTPA